MTTQQNTATSPKTDAEIIAILESLPLIGKMIDIIRHGKHIPDNLSPIPNNVIIIGKMDKRERLLWNLANYYIRQTDNTIALSYNADAGEEVRLKNTFKCFENQVSIKLYDAFSHVTELAIRMRLGQPSLKYRWIWLYGDTIVSPKDEL